MPTIYLSDDARTVQRKIRRMVTDITGTHPRLRADDPGVVDYNPVFNYHDAFNPNTEEVADLKATPVYLLGVPLLLIGLRQLGELASDRPRSSLATVAVAGLLFLGACAWTSRWIEGHAALRPVPPQSMNPSPGPGA